jgi:hypothetical protein
LLTPATILGTPAEAGLNQKNSTSLTLGTQTAFDFLPAKELWRINATLQQASLSQNAQRRSQKPFKPCAEFCNLFVGHNTRAGRTLSLDGSFFLKTMSELIIKKKIVI